MPVATRKVATRRERGRRRGAASWTPRVPPPPPPKEEWVWERIDPRSDAYAKLCNLMAGRGKMQYSDRAGGSALSVSYELSEAHCDHFHGRSYADMRRYRAYLESDGVTVAHQLMQPEPLHWHTLQPSEKPQAMCSCSSPEMADRGLKSPDCSIRGTHLSCEDPDCPGFDVCAPCYQLHDLQTKEALSSVQGYIRDGRYQRMPVVPHAGASESFAHLAQEPIFEEARQLIGRYRTSLALAEATVKGTIAKATAAVLKVLGDFGEACDRILSLEPAERLNSRPVARRRRRRRRWRRRGNSEEKARQAEAARLGEGAGERGRGQGGGS